MERTPKGHRRYDLAKLRGLVPRTTPLNRVTVGYARVSSNDQRNVDAIHIAAATVHGMDYLLTWNCKHIANAQIQGKLAEISLDFGYELPILCTPYELIGD